MIQYLLLSLFVTFTVHADELDAYKGKTIYVDFWASWCEPCKESFGWLNQMQKQFGDNKFTVVGINLDKERPLADEFLKAHPATFPIIYDPDAKLAEKYGVKGMPFSMIMDQNGKKTHQHIGFSHDEKNKYKKQIEEALAASKK